MSRRSRQGFTLPELMAVVSIIALLAAMLMPTFSNVFSVARTTLCVNQLEKIGQAYHSHNAMARANAEPNAMSVWGSTGWTGAVLKETGNSQELLICPESDAKTIGGALRFDELSSLYVVSYGPDRWTGNWEATEYTLGQGMTEGWPQGIENRSMFWEVMQKSSNSITLAMEDSWQDNSASRSYKDLIIRFDFAFDETRVTYVSQGTGAFHYSLHYPNGEMIMEGMGQGINHGKEGQMNASVDSLTSSSYGMNSRAAEIRGPKGVVLVLDFNKPIADCAGEDARDVGDRWEEYIARRHRNKVNVLWENGAVQTLYDDLIDPDTDEGRKKWGP